MGIATDWGPIGAWAGAGATLLIVVTTALVALGYFDFLQRLRLHLTFEPTEPWCRQGKAPTDGSALWERVGVENAGSGPARGCLGRLLGITTDGDHRSDVDPVQLRWQGCRDRVLLTQWMCAMASAST
jgi:hypothetical protein